LGPSRPAMEKKRQTAKRKEYRIAAHGILCGTNDRVPAISMLKKEKSRKELWFSDRTQGTKDARQPYGKGGEKRESVRQTTEAV